MSELRKAVPLARRKIVDLFVDQCSHGAQVRDLPTGTTACGQFLGPNARSLPQRGIYGTAAALRVLAEVDDVNARALVRKLVHYIQHRELIEASIDRQNEGLIKAKCRLDERNVLKLSDILHALSCVKHGAAETDEVKTRLVRQLQDGRIENRGWGYFVGDQEPELIPTAYAIRALTSLGGYDVSEPSRYLLSSLNSGNGIARKNMDIMINVLVLFALTFSGGSSINQDDLERLFDPLWRLLEPLLHNDLEQNIEYWHGSENLYVRIPWQLYLLSLAAKIRPRRLGSKAAQERSQSIVASVMSAGFLYPHSGKMLSSRTNAIVYETLGILGHGLNYPRLLPVYLFDVSRSAMSTKSATVVAGLTTATLAVYSIVQWSKGTGKMADLAPNILWSIMLGLMTLRKSR